MSKKLVYFALIIVILFSSVTFVYFQVTNPSAGGPLSAINDLSTISSGNQLSINYITSNYANYGTVFDPIVNINVSTPSGTKSMEFLLDSGAVVSAMPKSTLEDFDITFEDLNRIVVKGHGSTFFAYMSNITVEINGKQKSIPVLFTDTTIGSKVLGRRGFFDQYNVEFNSEKKKIIIKEF